MWKTRKTNRYLLVVVLTSVDGSSKITHIKLNIYYTRGEMT